MIHGDNELVKKFLLCQLMALKVRQGLWAKAAEGSRPGDRAGNVPRAVSGTSEEGDGDDCEAIAGLSFSPTELGTVLVPWAGLVPYHSLLFPAFGSMEGGIPRAFCSMMGCLRSGGSSKLRL